MLLLLSLCLENCMFFPLNSLNLSHDDLRKIDTWSFYPHISNVSKLTTELNPCTCRMNATPFTFANGWSLQLQPRKILRFNQNALIETTRHLQKNIETIHPFKPSAKTIHWNLPLMEGNDPKDCHPASWSNTFTKDLGILVKLKSRTILTIKKGRKSTNCKGGFSRVQTRLVNGNHD